MGAVIVANAASRLRLFTIIEQLRLGPIVVTVPEPIQEIDPQSINKYFKVA
jgi:hypothetical protein